MNNPGMFPSTATEADGELFDESISCDLDLPVEFRVGSNAGRAGAAESLLRNLAQIEDLRSDDASEDRADLPMLVQRMDAKLDLMLMLVGRLVRQSNGSLPLRPVRWSRRGMRLENGTRLGSAPGTAGVVCLQPSEWLPERIELPVLVISEAANGSGGFFLWLRFTELGAGLEMALERHLFRLHRRQVAESRRAR